MDLIGPAPPNGNLDAIDADAYFLVSHMRKLEMQIDATQVVREEIQEFELEKVQIKNFCAGRSRPQCT